MNQEQIAALCREGYFPDGSRSAQLIETHISWILLSERYAYKIKKPIRYSFLDFSTPELRHYYCERELLLNKRLAPDVYLDVVPVCLSEAGITIGSTTGQIIDHALLMVRQDYHRQMNLMLQQGLVQASHMEDIALQLAEFHRKASVIHLPPDPAAEQERFADLRQIGPCVHEHLGRAAHALLVNSFQWSSRFLRHYAWRFAQRERLGFIIDGHGDLHTRNIFLLDKPVIFDCIEFNDTLRQIDLLDELAFFCMDLDFYQRADLAEVFLRSYLRRINCWQQDEDRLIFLYYKLYRANIRLKVNGLRAMQADSPESREITHKAMADYFKLFSGYLYALRREYA